MQAPLPSLGNAPGTLLQRSGNAAIAASRPLQRFCNTFGCCNCCFLLLRSSCYAPGHCCFLASAMLLQRSWTLRLLLRGFCNAPAKLLDTTASWPLRRSCSAPGRCNQSNRYFPVSMTLLQGLSWTLQLLLPGPYDAPAATLLDATTCCFPAFAPATLLDTAASWHLQRSCKAPRRCNRCNRYFLVSATLLQNSCNAPGRCNCCFLASAKLL